jgi:AraC-like DNA-binding protein
VAGLSDVPALVESDGVSSCLQIDLTPLGARRFLGVELDGLSNRVVAFDDVLGAAGRELVDRLHDAQGWPARFAMLDQAIASRIAGSPPPDGDLAWAWRRIRDCAGALGIGTLASEIGCSRKHLTTRFTRSVGLPPKTVARIERFQRAVRLLEGEAPPRGAELALACGYFDQAHFVNDFRALSGLPPGEYRRRVVPGGGVVEPR